MGSFSNGVYVPAIGEVGWGTNVNDFLTRSGEEYVNVKQSPYGAKGDGATDDTAAIQAALNSGAAQVVFPKGTYFLADGSSLTVPENTRILALSHKRNGVVISTKNAYAFIVPPATPCVNVEISGFGFVLRSGSTTGGAIRAFSTTGQYNSGWSIHHIEAESVSTCTDPIIHLSGWIGSYLHDFRIANGGGSGVYVGGIHDGSGDHGFASNQWAIKNGSINSCGQAATTYAGIELGSIGGEAKGLIEMIDIESNHCYGIYGTAGSMTVRDNWFEDNWFTSIKAYDCQSWIIEGNRFEEPHNPETANTRHIHFTETVPTRGNAHRIVCNHFFGPNNGGYAVQIGANVAFTHIEGNTGSPSINTTTVDGGLYTVWADQQVGTGVSPYYLPMDTSKGGGIAFRNHGDALSAAPVISAGTGGPEGVVARPVGSVYIRSDGGPGTVLYTKGTGAGNTGWSNLGPHPTKLYSDAATITPDLADGDVFGAAITAARTFAAPLNPVDGTRITFLLSQSTGGPITPVWNAVYSLSTTFTLATAKRSAISFVYWGAATRWYETSRSMDMTP